MWSVGRDEGAKGGSGEDPAAIAEAGGFDVIFEANRVFRQSWLTNFVPILT